MQDTLHISSSAIEEEDNEIELKNKNNFSKKNNRNWERIVEALFLVSACIAILSIIIISVYIFAMGTPAIFQIGVFDFIFGLKWKPTAEVPQFGIFAMIIASILGTIGAIVVGVPIGLLTAVLLAEIAPKWVTNIIRPCIELLAGIPSIVYGFFGLVVIVPLIDKIFNNGGNSLLAMIFILSFMILPTIINISETSLRAVPKEYKEGSLALGATHIETIFKVMVPAAKSGILAAVVLGIGRAIGETMAVILVCGNTVQLPDSILSRVRPMTANIALEMAYAAPFHEKALMATGVILFIFIMILNIVLNKIVHKAVKD